MIEKLSTILMLYLLAFAIIVIPVVRGFDKHPDAVQSWFENLPNIEEKMVQIHFYLHDIIGGDHPTSLTVAEAKISATSSTEFGLIRMMDDTLTVGPEPDSKRIGQVQGTNGGSSFDERSLLMTLSFLFTEGEYNGSTLSVLGRDPYLNEFREMPIIGGTGVFRLARGIIAAETVLYDMTTDDGIDEFTATVLYYA